MDTDEALKSPFAVSRLLERVGFGGACVGSVLLEEKKKKREGWITNEQVPARLSVIACCLLLSPSPRETAVVARGGPLFPPTVGTAARTEWLAVVLSRRHPSAAARRRRRGAAIRRASIHHERELRTHVCHLPWKPPPPVGGAGRLGGGDLGSLCNGVFVGFRVGF